jgi:microcystin-dependent protein
MPQPFVGEIRMFAGNFAPAGWMFCAGQLLPISENETLFNLIGTTYGGDGQSTFQLPNLQGRGPIHMGTGSGLSSYVLGESGGVESVSLTVNQIPIHNHPMTAVGGNQQHGPGDGFFAVITSSQAGVMAYDPTPANVPLLPASIGPTGGSQPHDNMQPYLCLNYIISLFGVFPSQT